MTYPSAVDKRLVRLLSILLLCAGAASCIALVAARSLARTSYSVGGMMLLTGIVGLVVNRRSMANLCLAASSIAMTLYLVEGGVELSGRFLAQKELRLKLQYAASQGRAFDLRVQGEFLRDLWAEGRTVFPAFPRSLLLREKSEDERETVLKGDDGSDFLPLGSISNTETVRGNETGEYLVYNSDEHGFHNPPGVWSLPRLEIAAVGDSFVQGESVPSDRNMIAVIRSYIPETLNLGHGGNGPLSELGAIQEFLTTRRPRIVLWVFSKENDIHEDLEREKRSPVLMGYLEDPPRIQGLELRQAEIDKKLRLYFDKLTNSLKPETALTHLTNWITLRELALAVYQFRHRPKEDFPLFQRVLAAANKTVSSWNGSLVLVYLPMTGNIMPSSFEWKRKEFSQRNHEQVLRICADLSIPVLDIEKRFAAEASRSKEYFYPYRAHFTEKGYQRAAELILEELSKQGLLESRLGAVPNSGTAQAGP